MNWITNFLFSSVGKKLIMSLTGLFLCLFLVVHMAGNLVLLDPNGARAFNEYAYFMTTFPPIKVASIFTMLGIAFHIIDGIVLSLQNQKSRPTKYAASKAGKSSSWASRNMGLLGVIIFFFIIIHLKSFWFEMKFGSVPYVEYDGNKVKDLHTIVMAAFKSPLYVLFYLISLAAISFHLWHGFQSAFRSLGFVHNKYTPIIKILGYIIAIGVPFGFALQPIAAYLIANGII